MRRSVLARSLRTQSFSETSWAYAERQSSERHSEETLMNDQLCDWPALPTVSSDRVEKLRHHAAELAGKARSAQAEDERRTLEALAKLFEGTARSFANIEAFNAAVVSELKLS